MAGVEVQAHICHTLLGGTPGRELPSYAHVAWFFALFLAAGLGFSRLTPAWGLAILAGAIVMLGGTSLMVFMGWRYWLPPVLPSMGLTLVWAGHALSQYLVELREKRWLRHAFSRYLSPRVIELLAGDHLRLDLGGEEMEVTVLFADLAGFTGLSEEMPPPELVRTLNEFLTPMTRIILEYEGTLDKYIGDCIMAFWGAPLPLRDPAVLAYGGGVPPPAGGVAHPGSDAPGGQAGNPLRAGGGRQCGFPRAPRLHRPGGYRYLAARLETVNKVYGTHIISQATRQQLPDTFLVRELDRVQVRGREGPVTIYELLTRVSPGIAPPLWLDRFAAGRQAFLNRDWQHAADLFQEVLALKKGDRPARLLPERCQEYLASPPASDWDGLYVVEGR
jgi:adenylate cyclase